MAIRAGTEAASRANVEAFNELGFAPRVASLSSDHDPSTTVMNKLIALP